MMTEFSEADLVRRAGLFGGRLKDRIGGDVVVTVKVNLPLNPLAHILDGQTDASWPLPSGYAANVGVPTLGIWMDPVGAADQVAEGIEESMKRAMASL